MVTVTWQPLASATYHLYRASDSTSRGADVSGALAVPTFTDKTLQTGTLYFYHIEATGVPTGPSSTPAGPGGTRPPAPTTSSKPEVSAPQRFTLAKPTAVELPKKKP